MTAAVWVNWFYDLGKGIYRSSDNDPVSPERHYQR